MFPSTDRDNIFRKILEMVHIPSVGDAGQFSPKS